MFTYRIVLNAYSSRSDVKGAQVVTYSQGHNRAEALRRVGTVHIASSGVVSDGITPWPGTWNMPRGNVTTERFLPEYEVVSMRSVPKAGTARILAE